MNVKNGSKLNHLLAMPRQKGGITIFTAVFVLILMTLMLFYAAKVGMFDQRVSGNEARQKLAFHVAESGLDYAVEYLLAANTRVLSKSTQAQAYVDGTGTSQSYPGWFSSGNTLWAECPDSPSDEHPCGGGTGGTGSFYYDDPATTTTDSFDTIPLDDTVLGNLPAGTEVRVTAIICPRTLTDPTCLGDAGIPVPGASSDEVAKFSIWLLSYGYSDCNDDNGVNGIEVPEECRGSASVAIPFGSFSNFDGPPSVPLVAKNSLPATGTAEVVPNPNGGGIGVPLSIWANGRTSECQPTDSDGDVGESLTVEGSFKTCEFQEWYCMDVSGNLNCDSVPEDGKCPENNTSGCSCTYPGTEPISYRQGGVPIVGMDVRVDESFPCDLFEFYFGVPSAEYQVVKANATVIDDCSILNTESAGFYWFSGDTCTLGEVGTVNSPVLLVSAAQEATVLTGGYEFFGILYVADVEDTGTPAVFKPGGGSVIYGAAVVDVPFPNSGYAGTFKVVYNAAAVNNADGLGSLGGLAGGWRDFGLPTITWE